MRSSFVVTGAALLLASVGLVRASASTPPTMVQGIAGNVEHGRYLVENVAMCVECHSDRDAAGNIIDATRFHGGPVPVRPPWPNDWAIRAPRNAGLPGYDDEQAMRLLTEGAIGRDGRQLRPPMPRFHMSKQDAADVIAFMRSLQ
ncbi:MAG TPA: c-type cytochrome [Vicinamibacterales bacterium]|nr:c-type cytochrome [Vicinamibacterales bacterium]